MSFIRKIAKEKEQQQCKEKSAENESSGSANVQGKYLFFHLNFTRTVFPLISARALICNFQNLGGRLLEGGAY